MINKSYKVMLLGSMSVGKTSIARRLKFNTFEVDHKSTIGVQLYSFTIEQEGQKQEIVLWDTDGEYGDDILKSVYVKGSDAAIVVGDASRDNTLESMLNLYESFTQYSPGCPALSLINKADLKLRDDSELSRFTDRCDEVRQCSAKNNEGVLDSIKHVTKLISARNV